MQVQTLEKKISNLLVTNKKIMSTDETLTDSQFQLVPANGSSSNNIREEDVKRLVENGVHDKGIQLGSKIEGIIDGKFDKGYLVTINMGPQELTGVLYHSAPSETPRRRKKKAKLCHVYSLRPKFPRSGYNFFFSEEYKRLKAANAEQEHYLAKEIGNNWRNLSPSDREVYQEKGAEDIERYKREMAVYKSFVDSLAAGSVAATDNAVAKAEAADEAEDEAEAGL
ncbi:high mobility group B protein 10 [Brassica rapa]|uniref:HMG box domain-containing protein n=3 Tax=Brassica TaxID=3705 RepID=A0A3P6BZZ5_BRACM|nr:high mobility group B protein 10 [Brassica rapa]XP_013726330.1 high mobility group B protein 10 [Brassica napus]KAH0928871.1 hypothetical protein HID58_014598 [Brassica napus]CAF2269519.1 unnamed protein product [Brassica napus]CAG7906033.1 unnamed protein product [Brassica rapa]VDD11563.1 unnamed protein product [Brassica rapa]